MDSEGESRAGDISFFLDFGNILSIAIESNSSTEIGASNGDGEKAKCLANIVMRNPNGAELWPGVEWKRIM